MNDCYYHYENTRWEERPSSRVLVTRHLCTKKSGDLERECRCEGNTSKCTYYRKIEKLGKSASKNIPTLLKIVEELEQRAFKCKNEYSEFEEYSVNKLCDKGIKLLQKLKERETDG